MKIAVLSMGSTKESLVSNSFGRAPYIIIYYTDLNQYLVTENAGAQSKHGAGTETAEMIIKNKIDILLTKEVGVKAYSVLAKAHIDIRLLTSINTVKSAINKYLKKQEN
ncbi:MAG: NifB/NifX family molybdenum-iron cluster-binding protein [Ignavibacteriales bacterium]|nr:NifB/NifX family molybdenum-iron cluster-binding protein [Ignavibacteriales bacterium]